MFDTIHCKYKLPDQEAQGLEFQTKDLECLLDNYTITEQGRLVRHVVDYEDTPADELPYKDDPNPLLRFCGSIRPVPGSERDEDMNYHGWLNFYGNAHTGELRAINVATGEDTLHPGPSPQWYEYRAKFTDGTVVEIQQVEEKI